MYRNLSLMVVLAVLLLATISCGGGGSGFSVGNINGPSSIVEKNSAAYWVNVSGDTGIVYAWACDPVTAGYFVGGTTGAITFYAYAVDKDTNITIRLSVHSDHYGPVIKEIAVKIKASANFGWASTWGGSDSVADTEGYGIASDNSGHIYVCGRFEGTVDFGTTVFTSHGDFDIF